MSRWVDLDDGNHTYCGKDGDYERWNIDVDAINASLPLAQKTGRWIKYKLYISTYEEAYIEEYHCSKCKYSDGEKEWNYCPNCGEKKEVEK